MVHGFSFFKIPISDLLHFFLFLPHLHKRQGFIQLHRLEHLNQGFLSFSDAAFGKWVPASRLSSSVSLDEFQPVRVLDRFSAHHAHIHEITGHPKGNSAIILFC